MVNDEAGRRALGLPEGYRALPFQTSDQTAALRLCVLARETPDPAAGHLVLLRDLHDARVYLGCVTDAAGRLHEWIELWVQTVEGLEASLPGYRETFSNHALDARWTAQAAAWRELNPAGFIVTGWETIHPPPTFLDLANRAPVHPAAGDGGRWELCREDALLQDAGLPPFSSSLQRFLHQPAAGAGTRFVPVTTGAPTSPRTCTFADALGASTHHVPLNPEAGHLMVCALHPLGFEDYVDLLGGKPWPGLEHGKKHLRFDGPYAGLSEWNDAQQTESHLFLGAQGRAGRFLETFHLKLQLLTEAIRQARALVEQTQLPFLNLGADSFRVALGSQGAGLPALWTARCQLARPSHAYALPVQTSDFRYFIRARAGAATIYLPEGLSASLQGLGTVRLRKVLPPEDGRTVIEGTLVMQERPNVSPHDLLWIRVPLPSGRLDLYGHLYTTEGLAQGDVRFRTVPQKLPDATVKALRDAEGVSFARSPFEVVPLLSSPCDLYSLGVLAIRALLVDDESTLAVALDEMLSLARHVRGSHTADDSMNVRLRQILLDDARWIESLGPQHLVREKMDSKTAFQLLPADLWYETLGAIVRMFPGMGPDSACKDFGDVPSLALETVFNQALAGFEKLLVRSRSLIVIDWSANREIHAAIGAFLKG